MCPPTGGRLRSVRPRTALQRTREGGAALPPMTKQPPTSGGARARHTAGPEGPVSRRTTGPRGTLPRGKTAGAAQSRRTVEWISRLWKTTGAMGLLCARERDIQHSERTRASQPTHRPLTPPEWCGRAGICRQIISFRSPGLPAGQGGRVIYRRTAPSSPRAAPPPHARRRPPANPQIDATSHPSRQNLPR